MSIFAIVSGPGARSGKVAARPPAEWRVPFLPLVGTGDDLVPVNVRAGLPDPAPGLFPGQQLTRMPQTGRLSNLLALPVTQIRSEIVCVP